jgi:hypothetical protein
MTRSVGTSLGVAATGAVLGLRLAAGAGGQVASTAGVVPAVLRPAFQESLLFLVVLALAAAAVSAVRAAPAGETPPVSGRAGEGRAHETTRGAEGDDSSPDAAKARATAAAEAAGL